jgi:parallel beta-helix repeat protein
MRQATLVAAVLCGLLLSTGGAGLAATYVVDQVKGDDGAAGTAAAPWKTVSRGVKDLKPGDTLLIQPGVYRETVDVTCRGTAEAPITIQGSPAGRALITGADPVTAWKKCTGEEAGGNPNFEKIYYADLDFQPTVLFEDGQEAAEARSPRQGSWKSTAATDTTITDTVNLTQTRDVWHITLIHLTPPKGEPFRRYVMSFDPAKHTLTLNRPLAPEYKPEDGPLSYYLEGRLPGLDGPGVMAWEPRGKEGENSYRVYYWPKAEKIEAAHIELPHRTRQIVLSNAAWVTVEGLELAYGAMPERSDECALGAQGDEKSGRGPEGLVVKNCSIHHHRRFGVFLVACKGPKLINCLVHHNGWGIMLAGNTDALIEGNEIGSNTVDGFRDTFGGTGTVFRRNYIHHHFDSPEHPDNIQLHNDVKNITFDSNLVLCGGQSCMMSEVNGCTFRNNVIAGSAANMVICMPVNDLVFERNTCALGAMSIIMPGGSDRYKVRGNIFVHNGGSIFYAFEPNMKVESDDNLFWMAAGQAGRPWRAANGSFASLEELRKASPLEAHSEYKDPQFKNVPVAVATQLDEERTGSASNRITVDNIGLFQPGDHVELNFDGVVRAIKAVEGKAIVIDPPLNYPTVFIFVVNWKDKTNFQYDFSSPFNDKYGSTINVPQYMKGDFNGDGKRDVPDWTK